MAIFRGVGGSGSSSDNSFLQEVTAQAQAAEASATSAANSLTALQNTSIIELSELQTITSQSNLNLKFNSNGSQSTSLLKIFNDNTNSTALEVNSLGKVGIGGSVSGYNTAPRDDNTLSIGTMDVGITASEAVVGIKGETGKPHIALQAPDSGETTHIALTDTYAFVIAKGISNLLTVSNSGNLIVGGTVEGRDVAYDGSKLDTIEAGATADQTDAEIKTAYENNTDTNAFTDADHTKLDGIETSATADQTGAEIKTAYEAVADTNAYTDAEKTKLSGIEASADVTDTANVTSAGAAMLASSPTFTGTITAPNVDISTTGSVTTNIATGSNNANTTDVKVVNIGTGYGTGFYAGLSTTINMGSQSSNAQNIFNIGNGTTSGFGENTINLKGNVTVDGTVDGRDVATDGTRLDTIPYHRVRYEKLRYNYTSVTLTTSYQNISQAPEIYSPTTSVKCSRYIDFQTEIEWKYISSTNNDLNFKLEVTVPTSSATVTTLGTATVGTFSGYTKSGFEGWFYVSGDFTHHLTAFGRMNKTGVSGATEVPARAWHYDPINDRTYILTDSNPGYYISTGDTVYWHPYAWESAGTTLFIEDTLSERYVGTGSRQNITLRFKTAYDDNQLKYKAYLRELLSTDSAVVRGGEATLTEVGEV